MGSETNTQVASYAGSRQVARQTRGEAASVSLRCYFSSISVVTAVLIVDPAVRPGTATGWSGAADEHPLSDLVKAACVSARQAGRAVTRQTFR